MLPCPMVATANSKISPKEASPAAFYNPFQFCNLHFAQRLCHAETLPLQCDTQPFAFSSGEEKVNRYRRELTRPLTSFQTNHLTFSNRYKFAFSEVAENSCSLTPLRSAPAVSAPGKHCGTRPAPHEARIKTLADWEQRAGKRVAGENESD
jgi:hypothetical protein